MKRKKKSKSQSGKMFSKIRKPKLGKINKAWK